MKIKDIIEGLYKIHNAGGYKIYHSDTHQFKTICHDKVNNMSVISVRRLEDYNFVYFYVQHPAYDGDEDCITRLS